MRPSRWPRSQVARERAKLHFHHSILLHQGHKLLVTLKTNHQVHRRRDELPQLSNGQLCLSSNQCIRFCVLCLQYIRYGAEVPCCTLIFITYAQSTELSSSVVHHQYNTKDVLSTRHAAQTYAAARTWTDAHRVL